MRVGIIDADLLGRKAHRFPNLCCMKISGYLKEQGHQVELVKDCRELSQYDELYEAKVFTDTPEPIEASLFNQTLPKLHRGGTGYFFDKAPPLPIEIEHHMPDYHLYDGAVKAKTQEYTDFSIGYLTRGCFRKCPFCVNQKYNRAFRASPLREFLDESRKKICLLDDNFLSYREWEPLMQELMECGKPFIFKQGLDERILDAKRCEYLFKAKYCGDYTFAFDNIRDYPLVKEKLQLIRRYTDTTSIRFYVLCGFEGTDHKDIEETLARVALLFHYGARPYIMRFQSRTEKPYLKSRWAGIYNNLARWANQPSFCKKMSFREFCEADNAYQQRTGRTTECASLRVMKEFGKEYPDIAGKYFDVKFKQWE